MTSIVHFSRLPFRPLAETVSSRMVVGREAMLVEHRVKKGHFSAEESHPNEQISWVLRGSVRFTVEGICYLLQAGDAILIAPAAVHSCEVLEDSEVLEVFSPPRTEWVSQ